MPSARYSCRSVNRSGSGWPKKNPPSTSPAGRAQHRDGEVAAHGQVPRRHPVVRRVLAEPRVPRDVGAADGAVAVEGRREHRGVARHREPGERLARHARNRVQRVRLAELVDQVVEERAELRRRSPWWPRRSRPARSGRCRAGRSARGPSSAARRPPRLRCAAAARWPPGSRWPPRWRRRPAAARGFRRWCRPARPARRRRPRRPARRSDARHQVREDRRVGHGHRDAAVEHGPRFDRAEGTDLGGHRGARAVDEGPAHGVEYGVEAGRGGHQGASASGSDG